MALRIRLNVSALIQAEDWVDLMGWEGLYQISDLGRLKRMERWVETPIGAVKNIRGKMVKLEACKKGYLSARVTKDGVQKRISIQREVLKHFVGPCPEGKECCHIRPIKSQVNKENLYWGTHRENLDNVWYESLIEGINRGRSKNRSGSALKMIPISPKRQKYHRSLLDSQVMEIIEYAKTVSMISQVRRRFSSYSTDVIYNICTGFTYRHLSRK